MLANTYKNIGFLPKQNEHIYKDMFYKGIEQ